MTNLEHLKKWKHWHEHYALHIIKADMNGSKQGWRNRLNENGTGAVFTNFQILAVKELRLQLKNL